jgi:hypothetical protein
LQEKDRLLIVDKMNFLLTLVKNGTRANIAKRILTEFQLEYDNITGSAFLWINSQTER